MGTPAEFSARMEANIKPADWTTHEGTLKDSVPIGEFGEWGIFTRIACLTSGKIIQFV